MALLFMDGFGNGYLGLTYKYEDIYRAGDSLYWGESTSIVRRIGSKSIVFKDSSNYIKKDINPSGSTIIIQLAFYCTGCSNNYELISPLENGTNQQCVVMIQADGSITVRTSVYGTILATTDAGIVSLNTWNYISVKLLIGNSGAAKIVLNGNTVIDVAGIDTQAQSTSNITSIKFYTAGGSNMYLQDLVIMDDSGSTCNDIIEDVRVDIIRPSGAGNYSQFTPLSGNNYENVDESGIDNNTTYNTSDAANEIDTYVYSDLESLGSVVYGIAINTTSKKSDAGTMEQASVIRIGTTDYVQNTKTVSDSYINYQDILELNPNDSEIWEESDINSAEFGLKRITE